MATVYGEHWILQQPFAVPHYRQLMIGLLISEDFPEVQLACTFLHKNSPIFWHVDSFYDLFQHFSEQFQSFHETRTHFESPDLETHIQWKNITQVIMQKFSLIPLPPDNSFLHSVKTFLNTYITRLLHRFCLLCPTHKLSSSTHTGVHDAKEPLCVSARTELIW